MKSIAIITGLFSLCVLGAPVGTRQPVSDLDSFNYTNNINNAVNAEDVVSDSFDYTNNINNAVNAKDATSDSFNYTNNIDNAAIVVDADGTKVILSSPYADDVAKADPAKVLGE
ncbi:hypothetical protein GGR55DRAFT_139342 [Xylaria sp. FL0064]|nr:hypothetical protein GGR55DRAFT_139342 [Xylaria sp. FL0064]